MLTAAVIAEAVVILLLAAAGAGLLRRVRELELATYNGVGINLGTSDALPLDLQRPTMLVKLTQHCSVCDDIARSANDLADELPDTVDLVLVVERSDSGRPHPGRAQTLVDPALWRALPVPYAPALLDVDASGTIVNSQPIGSVERLRELLRAKQEVPR